MESSEPLKGLELIDCARANSNESIAIAAERCGYASEIKRFEDELEKAGEAIGVEIQNFSDLNTSTSNTLPLTNEF
jgi:hypothetical protein